MIVCGGEPLLYQTSKRNRRPDLYFATGLSFHDRGVAGLVEFRAVAPRDPTARNDHAVDHRRLNQFRQSTKNKLKISTKINSTLFSIITA